MLDSVKDAPKSSQPASHSSRPGFPFSSMVAGNNNLRKRKKAHHEQSPKKVSGSDTKENQLSEPAAVHDSHCCDRERRKVWCFRAFLIGFLFGLSLAILAYSYLEHDTYPDYRNINFPKLPPLLPELEKLRSNMESVWMPRTNSRLVGEMMAEEDWRKQHPVIFIPGVTSCSLELWDGEECAKAHFRQRLYGGAAMMTSILFDVRSDTS